jgi:HSP20 family protein
MLRPWAPLSPVAWDPLSLLRVATADVERLFGALPAGLMPNDSRAMKELRWTPSVDVVAKDDRLTIRVDLPGLTRDEVKVDVADDAITIQGERKKEFEEDKDGHYRLERAYGSFFRSVPLPDGVKPEEVKATFRNGVLEVTAPLPASKAAPAPHTVAIQEAPAEAKAKAATA